MAKFKAFWNYQKKKTGEIVIAEEELQEMLDAAWGAGYNQGRAETASPRIIPQNIPQNIPPIPTSTIRSVQYPWSQSMDQGIFHKLSIATNQNIC